ncbi:MAG TPA: deoxyribodipyrimidine photo-lyase [Gaiellaceae bacterium]|nr:deoxyribodipyrimidine photo-lyase [Gaiellaceae bacterium]HET8652477.1 deoxyribodipyrimidine photo-lyase [Gaiellaceae bacterium]
MRVAIVLFTRDLRVHDQPALTEAVRSAEQVVPLFVFDDAVLERFAVPNRAAFLLDCLSDLDAALRDRGAELVIRSGDVVAETMRVAREVGAQCVFVSEDVSAYAQMRERRLRGACEAERLEFRALPGATVVPPGDLAPAGADHYSVFTPYWNRWRAAARRKALEAPRRVALPADVGSSGLPQLADLVQGSPSAELPRGGEAEARLRLDRWARDELQHYGRMHDDLAADATSRLSPFLHFGCLSPLEVVERALAEDGGEPFVRQLAWRDFYAQLLSANPQTSHEDLRSRGGRWRRADEELAAWKEGRTGYPLVDAGMRQLQREGWMHNRARLVTASFLAKHLYLDWRLGAEHFFDLLVDGDLANNVGNWQWVAGTGADTRPNRVFNPILQAKRFDKAGDYVRRHVPELAEVEGACVHEPWKLGLLRPGGYPEPIVDHTEAVTRFRRASQRTS